MVDSVVTAALGAIVFVIGFGGDLGRLAGPLSGGDILPAYATAKLWSDGAPFGNNTLGYPFGMELRYYPTTDFLQNALAGLISALTGNPFVGMNIVFALSFPVTALAALWVFAIVGIRGPIAIFTSLAFTAIPFHWLRLEHIYLATMYSAALGVGLALLTGTGAIERRIRGRRGWPTFALLAVVCAVIATSGIYYACFTILLCSAALVYRLAHLPSWRRTMLSAIPIGGVATLTALALAPASLYVRANPALLGVADRHPIESVYYSGNLAFALIPMPLTWVPGLSSLRPRIEHAQGVAQSSGASGVAMYSNFGSLFTVLALGLAAVGLFWSVRRTSRDVTPFMPASESAKRATQVNFGLVGLLLATTILFFVPWGLNVVFAALVTPQLRGWDRLVPDFLLLLFVAAMVAWRTLEMPQRGPRALFVATGCLALLLFDSVLPYQPEFTYAALSGQQNLAAGTQYAKALNAAIPGKCAMLQIPNQLYPEEPNLQSLPVYDAFWPAVNNPEKQWTFGAMKGTLASEWQRVLDSKIDASAVADLLAGGFCGIQVDRRGFTASEDALVVKRLSALLGAPVATGHAGDWTAYALPVNGSHKVLDIANAAKLPDRLATFYYPPTIKPTPGDSTVGTETDAFGPWWRATGVRTSLNVNSLEPAAEFSELTGTVRAGDCSPRNVAIVLRTRDETVTTSFHLAPGQERDFALKLTQKATSANLSVTAPGTVCRLAANQRAMTVALLDTEAR